MDEDLRALARAVAADPTDEAAARRHDAALLQVGQRDQVRERFRFKFQCPLRWTDLVPSDKADVRHCGTCDRDVHAVRDEKQLRAEVVLGHCVAFPETLHREAFEHLEQEKTLHSAKDPSRPCIVLGGNPPVLPEDFADSLPSALVDRFHVVPIGLHDGRLVVAVSPQRLYRLDRVKRDGHRDIEAVLVSEDELSRLYERSRQAHPERGPMLMGKVAPPS